MYELIEDIYLKIQYHADKLLEMDKVSVEFYLLVVSINL